MRQTGSGTQINMNANEVITNRAAQLVGKVLVTKNFILCHDLRLVEMGSARLVSLYRESPHYAAGQLYALMLA